MLHAARESLDVTQREVADALNLPVHTIEAMETDDFENLPAAVFIRGYLRSYARLLDLDSDALIERCPQGWAETNAAAESVDNPVQEWVRQHPAWILGVGAVVVLLLLILPAIWWWSDDSAMVKGATFAEGAIIAKGATTVPTADGGGQTAPLGERLVTAATEDAAGARTAPAGRQDQVDSQPDALGAPNNVPVGSN